VVVSTIKRDLPLIAGLTLDASSKCVHLAPHYKRKIVTSHDLSGEPEVRDDDLSGTRPGGGQLSVRPQRLVWVASSSPPSVLRVRAQRMGARAGVAAGPPSWAARPPRPALGRRDMPKELKLRPHWP
jgi:hypothetical protein